MIFNTLSYFVLHVNFQNNLELENQFTRLFFIHIVPGF